MDWKYEGRSIFCVDNNGELTAEATYNVIDNDIADIDHTYVNPSLRGQGIAGELMKAVMDYMRDKGLKVMASCSYANAWLRKNSEEYSDIISEALFDQDISCRIDGKH